MPGHECFLSLSRWVTADCSDIGSRLIDRTNIVLIDLDGDVGLSCNLEELLKLEIIELISLGSDEAEQPHYLIVARLRDGGGCCWSKL